MREWAPGPERRRAEVRHFETGIPLIDVTPLREGHAGAAGVAREIDRACRERGFFYVVGHGMSRRLIAELEALSRVFFAQDPARKLEIGMARGGSAWRGYFPVGAELTSGRPDAKEGIYFGEELGDDDPRVAAGVPLFGANQFPEIPGFRRCVLDYMAALSGLGHTLVRGICLGLGLPGDTFAERYTADPLILFRIFHYPPLPLAGGERDPWSVAEHTDYGLLTILGQDDVGGLEVRSGDGWIEAPPVPDAFVCNIGDMLERVTSGRYRSTPHRVRNTSSRGRLSFPFFFDPAFDAEIRPIDPAAPVSEGAEQRWDRASVHLYSGTYGDYVLHKVARVFPDLGRRVL